VRWSSEQEEIKTQNQEGTAVYENIFTPDFTIS
jgi:hypothetical protein